MASLPRLAGGSTKTEQRARRSGARPILGAGTGFFLGIVTPHYAAIFFPSSKSASRVGRPRNDPAPKTRRLRLPIRAIETSARYDRGESSRETERVGHDPLWHFGEIYVSGLLLDFASSFPHRPAITSWIA